LHSHYHQKPIENYCFDGKPLSGLQNMSAAPQPPLQLKILGIKSPLLTDESALNSRKDSKNKLQNTFLYGYQKCKLNFLTKCPLKKFLPKKVF
jgi:hypothetical protein